MTGGGSTGSTGSIGTIGPGFRSAGGNSQISAAVPVVLAKMQEWMEYLLDVNNIKALALRSQVPAQDTVEAFNTIAGAITTDRSRTMEAAVEEVYNMFGALVFQFMNANRRLKEVGPSGLTKEDFDFKPDSLVEN